MADIDVSYVASIFNAGSMLCLPLFGCTEIFCREDAVVANGLIIWHFHLEHDSEGDGLYGELARQTRPVIKRLISFHSTLICHLSTPF
jgi:hypothetical protein